MNRSGGARRDKKGKLGQAPAPPTIAVDPARCVAACDAPPTTAPRAATTTAPRGPGSPRATFNPPILPDSAALPLLTPVLVVT